MPVVSSNTGVGSDRTPACPTSFCASDAVESAKVAAIARASLLIMGRYYAPRGAGTMEGSCESCARSVRSDSAYGNMGSWRAIDVQQHLARRLTTLEGAVRLGCILQRELGADSDR